MRVMTCSCSRRSQGRPSTRASNCSGVSVTDVPSVAHRGHSKLPTFSRLAALHIEAVVHQQLDPAGARVAKQIAVMGRCPTEHLNHSGE